MYYPAQTLIVRLVACTSLVVCFPLFLANIFCPVVSFSHGKHIKSCGLRLKLQYKLLFYSKNGVKTTPQWIFYPTKSKYYSTSGIKHTPAKKYHNLSICYSRSNFHHIRTTMGVDLTRIKEWNIPLKRDRYIGVIIVYLPLYFILKMSKYRRAINVLLGVHIIHIKEYNVLMYFKKQKHITVMFYMFSKEITI